MPRLLPALSLLLASPAGAAAVLHVPTDFPRVSDALAAAQPGDTVRVAVGTYAAPETFPLQLTAPDVVLEGAGMGLSVLDAGGSASVVRCTAAGVRLTRFTITGGHALRGGGGHGPSRQA